MLVAEFERVIIHLTDQVTPIIPSELFTDGIDTFTTDLPQYHPL